MSEFKYDLFISYANGNKKIADYLVDKIESRGYKCFIAPRDIVSGSEYASQIIMGISNSLVVLLVFSEQSDKSSYVLREINSAVSRNKTIIPFRIENFLPSEAMEFYLGVTHWLDAFPEVLDAHLDKLINVIEGLNRKVRAEEKFFVITTPTLLKLSQLNQINYTHKKLVMKEIEIDYLCIPPSKFNMNDEIEGTFEDWITTAKDYEEDTSVILVQNDEVMGYCDMYPVTKDGYKSLIEGEVIIRESMIEINSFGGDFDAYIAMMAILPDYASVNNYMLYIDWVFKHLAEWKSKGININNLGISVYSDLLEKLIIKLGFEFRGYNPAKGKIYETSIIKLRENTVVKNKYSDIKF